MGADNIFGRLKAGARGAAGELRQVFGQMTNSAREFFGTLLNGGAGGGGAIFSSIATAAHGAAGELLTFGAAAGVVTGIQQVSGFLAANQREIQGIVEGAINIGRAFLSIIVSVAEAVGLAFKLSGGMSFVSTTVQAVAFALTAVATVLGVVVDAAVKLGNVLAGALEPLIKIGASAAALGTLAFAAKSAVGSLALIGPAVKGFLGIGVAATEAATGVTTFAGAVGLAGTALKATAAFPFATPVGWAILAAAIRVAAIAYFNYSDARQNAAKITQDEITATAAARDEFALLSNQVGDLTGKQNLNATEHQRLVDALAKLPSGAQAAANAFQNEGEKAAFVTGELKQQKEIQDALLLAKRATLADSLSEQQKGTWPEFRKASKTRLTCSRVRF